MSMRKLAIVLSALACAFAGSVAQGQTRQSQAAMQGGAPTTQNQQAELDVGTARIGDRDALSFRVPFDATGTAFKLGNEAQQSLAVVALRAEKIQLRESFDSGGPADHTPELRDERLRTARAFLIGRGVAADRIEIVRLGPRPVLQAGGKPGMHGNPVIQVVVLLPEPGAPR